MRRCILAGTFVALACSGTENVSTTTVRDSAGVRIVENVAPSWDSSSAWRIEPTPLLSIGSTEGAADFQFTRIVGAARFEDGVLAVGDAGTNTVRLFDSTGRILRTVGGPGSGPGEFGAMQSIRRAGDSLDVLDRRRGRITIFDRSGNLVRTWQAVGVQSASAHRLAGGRWLVSEEDGFVGGRFREDVPAGLHRFPSTAFVLDSSGTVTDTVGVFPGAETAYYTLDGQPGSMPAAFGRTLRITSDGAEAFVATGVHFGFDVYASNGTLTRSVRSQGRSLPLDASEASRFSDALVAGFSNESFRAMFRRGQALAAVPATKAPVGRILLDPHGNVWLSEYENEFMPAATWFVFDPSGRYLGVVPLPPMTWLTEIGDRHVVAVTKDENDVESIRVHRLVRD